MLNFQKCVQVFNRDMFTKIPVDKNIYGKRGLDGNHIAYSCQLYEPLVRHFFISLKHHY